MVFDLGFGEGGFAAPGPIDGLESFEDEAFLRHRGEGLDLARLEFGQ